MRPILLDLFCGAGGAAAGYRRAGFDVVGVDLHPQPRYPFPFVQADALEYLAMCGRGFDAVHASPPCQLHSTLVTIPGRGEMMRSRYLDLIAPVRALLEAVDRPYVIENVPRAPLRDPVTLCGAMFPGLRVFRHRGFEANWALPQPEHVKHPGTVMAGSSGKGAGGKMDCYAGDGAAPDAWITVAGHQFSTASGSRAMGIDWMRREELAEAIPPAYTEYVGWHLRRALRRR
jgi:DNA (cytosine-5)-methyltransferase 1